MPETDPKELMQDSLLKNLGLLKILEMNDIEHHQVLSLLEDDGWLTMDDYFFDDVNQETLEMED